VGCEQIHKSVAALVDEDASRIVISYDAVNAFGSMPRQKIWEAVLARMPDLATTVQAWLGGSTTHIFWDSDKVAHPLEATCGVDQGCPLSPLLFALGVAAPLDSMVREIQALDAGARVFAYLGDIYVVVAPAHAEAAHVIVQNVLAAHGLALNLSKTAVWSRDTGTVLPPTLQANRKSELKLLGADVRFLDRVDDREEFGAPVRGSVNGAALVQSAQGVNRRLGELRQAGLKSKTAYTVLQTFAQSCCNHLQRANFEEGAWLADLEAELLRGLGNLTPAGSDLGDTQRQVASLRLQDGGLAFGGLRERSAAAFLASWALVLKPVAETVGVNSVEGFKSRCGTVWADMERAEAVLRGAGGNGGAALEWFLWFNEPQAGLQAVWGKEVSDWRRGAVLRSLSDPDAADLRSHGGPGAGSFLLPTVEGTTPMPDKHFEVSLCDRLLLPVCQEGARCQHRRRDGTVCGAILDGRGHHARKCCIGGALGQRHDILRDYSARSWAEHAGVPALTEQRVPEWDRQVIDVNNRTVTEEAVLDVVTSDPFSGQVVHVDVTVTTACPADAASLHGRARRDGRGAAEAAAAKRRRYNLAGATLVPMAFEDGGRAGEETVAFVRRCGSAAERLGSQRLAADATAGQPVTAQLWQGLSTLLQLGNAELVLSANGR